MNGIAIDSQYAAGVTILITVADTVINFATAALLAAILPTSGVWKGYAATMLHLTVITYPIYYAFGADPATDGSIGHPLAVGDVFAISNFNSIKELRLIRQSTNTGAIMLTPFYNKG
jgi:hypothetical protein